MLQQQIDPASAIRNKYNTLTPAEAKKLNKFPRQLPLRTASVLHKPRPPPIVVTNLDSINQQQQQQNYNTKSASDNNYRRATVSVDMGAPNQDIYSGLSLQASTMSIKSHHLDPMLRAPTIGRLKYNTMSSTSSRMFSDESYSSCRSETSSARSCNATPTKFYDTTSIASSNINRGGGLKSDHNKTKEQKPHTSDSKVSLSSSTYNKVFQSPFANFKKLLRNMPRPFTNNTSSRPATPTSIADINISRQDSQLRTMSVSNNYATCRRKLKLDSSCQSDLSLGDISISDSMSQISLNQSQSPPVCPPPPRELKSMSYMQSSINYSNYDEFTRARNERLATRHQVVSAQFSTQNGSFASLTTRQGGGGGGDKPQQLRATTINDDHETDWQLTSLPVYYEKNLTTLFEEKQASCDDTYVQQQKISKDNKSTKEDLGQQQHHMIKPPIDFEDDGDKRSINDAVDGDGHVTPIPATPYRFSFSQPLSSASANNQVFKNLGLPPRMPTVVGQKTLATGANSENSRLDNSSSGNSSNCSSQLNGINCDRPNSLETYSDDKNSYSDESATGYNNNLNGLSNSSNDADLTILSETSTIQGDTGIAYYANKCSELERTVTTLKNKLISKEKELTDLQLGQLNNDYTIERLKKQVNKLERENAQLRTMAASAKSQ